MQHALVLVLALAAAPLPAAGPAPTASGFDRLTIEHVYWYHSAERAEGVAMRLDDPLEAGHLVMHVREASARAGVAPYRDFWNEARKDFLLVADGRLPVHARATRGYWIFADRGLREFYLRLEPQQLSKLDAGVRYRLVPPPEANGRAWVATEDAVVVLFTPVAAQPDRGAETGDPQAVRTLDALLWPDDPQFSEHVAQSLGGRVDSTLFGHVVEWHGQDELKLFTAEADKRIWLRAAGRNPIAIDVGTGSMSNDSGETRFVFLSLRGGVTRKDLAGTRWMVEPSEKREQHWRVAGDARWLDLRN